MIPLPPQPSAEALPAAPDAEPAPCAAPYPLTGIALALLRYIVGYIEANAGVAPTLDEMAEAMDWRSPTSALRPLHQLEERGYIRRQRFAHRALEVIHAVPVPRDLEGTPLHFIPAARLGLVAPC